ncbi:MAG: acetate kinase [Oscillospiraceae bacterium]|nr:acetate kinase [Oscillospiraceae bacterium]
MKILVINAGSSSLKYQLINMDGEDVIAKGICERIGVGGKIVHKIGDQVVLSEETDFSDHSDAFSKLLDVLLTGKGKVINSISEIDAIGHRIVQGAEKFHESVLITDDVLKIIIDISDLAPLHNPSQVQAIQACISIFGKDIPQIATFDTAFHQTMPEKAYIYGIPYEYYEKYNIRKYGFHGTSHRFVSRRMADLLGKHIMDLKIVTCHLGNGCSVAAIDGGKSIDTSMGFTPLDGLLMGTRSGAVDPSVLLYIMDKEGITPWDMSDMLNKKSGIFGISGGITDDRDLRKASAEGDKRATLAGKIQRYQIKKLIGSYAAAMGGIDAVVFTGGIGENSALVREKVCDYMNFLGLNFDKDKNIKLNGKEAEISCENSRVKAWIIPTNEELLIAQDTQKIINRIR